MGGPRSRSLATVSAAAGEARSGSGRPSALVALPSECPFGAEHGTGAAIAADP